MKIKWDAYFQKFINYWLNCAIYGLLYDYKVKSGEAFLVFWVETGEKFRICLNYPKLAIRNRYPKVFWPKRNFVWPWLAKLHCLSHTISNFDWFLWFSEARKGNFLAFSGPRNLVEPFLSFQGAQMTMCWHFQGPKMTTYWLKNVIFWYWNKFLTEKTQGIPLC